MNGNIHIIGETPYAGETMKNSPQQLSLFDNQYDIVDKELLESTLRLLKASRKPTFPTFLEMMVNSLLTFNLAPSQDIWKHLRKAKIAHSPEESLASDWNNVSSDMYYSFLKNAIEVNRQIE